MNHTIRFIVTIFLLATHMLYGMDQPPSEARLRGIKTNPQLLLTTAQNMLASRPHEAKVLLNQIAQYSSDSALKLKAQLMLIDATIEEYSAQQKNTCHPDILSLWQQAKDLSLNEEERHKLAIQYASYLYGHAPAEMENAVRDAYIELARYQGKHYLPNIVHALGRREETSSRDQARYIAEIFHAHGNNAITRATMQGILANLIYQEDQNRAEILMAEMLRVANAPQCMHRWMLYAMYVQLLKSHNRHAEAQPYCEMIMQQTEDLERRAETCVMLGNEALKNNEHEKALDLFSTALASNPKRPQNAVQAHFGKAMAMTETLSLVRIEEVLALTLTAHRLQTAHGRNIAELDTLLCAAFGLSSEKLMPTNKEQTEAAALYYGTTVLKLANTAMHYRGLTILNELIQSGDVSNKHAALLAKAKYLANNDDGTSLDEAIDILQKLTGKKIPLATRIQARANLGLLLVDAKRYKEALPHLEYTAQQDSNIPLRFYAIIGLVDYYTANPVAPINLRLIQDIPVIQGLYESSRKHAEDPTAHNAQKIIAFIYGKTLLSLAHLWQKRNDFADGFPPQELIEACYKKASAISECPSIQQLAQLHYNAYKQQQESSPKNKKKKKKKKVASSQGSAATQFPANSSAPMPEAPQSPASSATTQRAEPDQIMPTIATPEIPRPLAALALADSSSSVTPEPIDLEENWENAVLHNRLLSAVKRGDTQTIKELVKQGADIHYAIQGKSIALWASDAACLSALLENPQPHATSSAPQLIHHLPNLCYSPQALAALNACPKQGSLVRALEDLRSGRGNIKALQGNNHPFSHRLRLGDMRIGFKPVGGQLDIVVIENRSKVYK